MEMPGTAASDTVAHLDADPLWRRVVQERMARLPAGACASCDSLGALQEMARRHGPLRLAVVEPRAPGGAIYSVLHACGDCARRVLVLTGHRCEVAAALMPRGRIAGVLYKHAFSEAEFRTAWQEIAAGRTYFAPPFARHAQQEARSIHLLTKCCSPRELAVLPFVTLGYSDARIATELSLSPWTIKNHRSSLLRKTGLGSTRELIAWAGARGFGP